MWSPDKLVDTHPNGRTVLGGDPTDSLVDIGIISAKYRPSNDDNEFEFIRYDNLKNTGHHWMKIPNDTRVCNQICSIMFLISWHIGATAHHSMVEVVITSDIYIILTSERLKMSTARHLACQAWLESEPASIGQAILNEVLSVAPCPSSLNQIKGDDRFEEVDDKDAVRPEATVCHRQNQATVAK